MYWFMVIRTTTDKLQDILNGWSEDWETHQVTHVGGRDWVVIGRCERLEGQVEGDVLD